MATFLKNKYSEYVQKIDTKNGKLIFTKNKDEAYNYDKRQGGGEWNSNNEREYIINYFQDELGDKVTSLKQVFEER